MNPLLIIIFFIFSVFTHSDIYQNELGCKTKLLQTMKATSSYSSRQGYGVVNFDINKDGSVSNIKATDSKCAISRNEDGSILFKKCPFFKKSSYAAARYLKFAPPKNEEGLPCSIKNKDRIFTYHKYKVRFKDKKEFLLDEDFSRFSDKSEPNEFRDLTTSNIPPVSNVPYEQPFPPFSPSQPDLPPNN